MVGENLTHKGVRSMKKIVSIAVSIILLLSLTGCCIPLDDEYSTDDYDYSSYDYDYSSDDDDSNYHSSNKEISVEDIKNHLKKSLAELGLDSSFTEEKTEEKNDKTIHSFKYLNGQVTVQIETSIGEDSITGVACWAFPSSFVATGMGESEALKFSAVLCTLPLTIFENDSDVDSLYQKIVNDGTSSTDDTTAYWEYDSETCSYSLSANSLTTMTTAKPF